MDTLLWPSAYVTAAWGDIFYQGLINDAEGTGKLPGIDDIKLVINNLIAEYLS